MCCSAWSDALAVTSFQHRLCLICSEHLLHRGHFFFFSRLCQIISGEGIGAANSVNFYVQKLPQM